MAMAPQQHSESKRGLPAGWVRYFMQLSYHGAAYHGWQRQPNAPTVQQTLEEALGNLYKEAIHVVGTGRTDAGVHARGYWAHVDLPAEPLTGAPAIQDLQERLNRMLPRDIVIHQLVQPAHQSLHARFSALSRSYTYSISREKDPFAVDSSLLHTQPLEVAAIQAGAALLLAHTDFAALAKTGGGNKTTLCHLTESRWAEGPAGKLYYHVTADRFLRGMVRAIVGTLLQLGRGELGAGEAGLQALEGILKSGDRRQAGMSAAAHGLCFVGAAYAPGALANTV